MEFDKFAGEYSSILDKNVAVSGEGSAYFARYKAQYLHRTLPALSFGKILDFGCGVGMLCGFLKEYFPKLQLHGFDVSEASLEKVSSDLKRAGYFTSNLSELSCDYDLIIVANVMHHIIPHQRREAIQELADRLANGGRIAIFEHNPLNPLTRWVVERCPFDEDAQLLPRSETTQYLRDANLHIQRRDYIVFMPHFLRGLRPLEPWLAWLPMGAQYVLMAEKRLSNVLS